jgi:hypothetical protein
MILPHQTLTGVSILTPHQQELFAAMNLPPHTHPPRIPRVVATFKCHLRDNNNLRLFILNLGRPRSLRSACNKILARVNVADAYRPVRTSCSS